MRSSVFLFGFIFLKIISCYSQKIYVQGGANYGSFYDFVTSEGPVFADYDRQLGFSFNVGIQELKLDSTFKPTIAIGFEQYGGDFYASDAGLGGGVSESGTLIKRIIDLEFYPLHVTFLKNATISAGFEVNYCFSKKLSGYRSEYQMGVSNIPDTDLNSIKGFVVPINFGLNLTAGYEFKLGNVLIKPTYKYFLGLLSDFNYIQSNAKSQRHIFQLGIGYKLP